MTSHLDLLHRELSRLGEAWADAGDATDLARRQLVAANEALGALRRIVDGLHAEIAVGISRESRTELGPESLAKQHGFRNAAQFIAAVSGVSTGDASRLVKVGDATADRNDLVGERLPARFPAVQASLRAGRLGIAAAGLIVALLDRLRVRIGQERAADAEAVLVEKAEELSLDEVRRLLTHAEAVLDPDGVEPREGETRHRRSLRMFERDGAFHLDGVFDIEDGAPIKAAIEGFVTATFAARKDAVAADAPDADHRTVAQLQADGLTAICAHALGCDSDAPATAGATVIVRVNHTDLVDGTGSATVDGCDRPISIGAVRRMAASGGVISCVLGADSEILDWGREKRLFTRAQRLALAERDGGCAMCGLPPAMTRAHHIRWWQRDAGPTDLANGVLLCESCHHRIHDNDWDIRVDGTGIAARVWFIPPPGIDPQRTPRPGGRARYTLAA